MFFIVLILMFLTKSILPLKYFFFFCFELASIKILDWNTAKDKMWNGIGWYGFVVVTTTSTTAISLVMEDRSVFHEHLRGILKCISIISVL